jgi:hypothetical protein
MNASVVAPASCPTRIVTRRSGVSWRRSRKPVSMSVAISVPAVMAANIAPWMKVTVIAKSR